jgi:murein L,D-transpeptidase YcbB/YkuD
MQLRGFSLTLRVILASLMGLLLSAALYAQVAPRGEGVFSAALQTRLELRSGRYAEQFSWQQLSDFYNTRHYQPVWIDTSGPTARAAILLETLQQAGNEGLEPAAYRVSLLEQLWHAKGLQQQIDLELLLTNAFFDYSRELHSGQLDPIWSEQLWHIPVAETDSIALLQALVASDDFSLALTSLPPTHPAYKGLREALARYRKLETSGGWQQIPEGVTLRLGSQDLRVPLLRRRLQLEGELQFTPVEDNTLFDLGLRYAVERFQLRHGLKMDGVVGSLTLAELNVSLSRRIAQIKLNMERWRWLPDQLGHRHIIVNVSAYRLSAYDHGERQFTMEAIIGTLENPTPLITGTIHTVVFNPYWTITRNIALEEVVPKQQRNPGYLTSRGIRVFSDEEELFPWQVNWVQVNADNFPYILRQDPGPENPLGKIKFLFTNNFNVYLHDTPARQLFDQPKRTFSHGCIRVADPPQLAAYLLMNEPQGEWSEETIRSEINTGISREVAVATPVPIYLLYLTAWVGDDGAINFRRDIYGEDEMLLIDLPDGEL